MGESFQKKLADVFKAQVADANARRPISVLHVTDHYISHESDAFPQASSLSKKQAKKAAPQMARIEALAAIRSANPWIAELSVYRRVPAQRAMLSATRVFGFAEMLFNKRITNEEIGDALESLAKHLKGSNPVWWVYIKLVTTIFWLVMHAIKEVRSTEKKGA